MTPPTPDPGSFFGRRLAERHPDLGLPDARPEPDPRFWLGVAASLMLTLFVAALATLIWRFM